MGGMGQARGRIAAAGLAAALAAVTPGPASAADLVYASGPGSVVTTYTQPVLVMRAGDKVTYANLDIVEHDVVATVTGPDRPWCAAEGFQRGKCPLFWTPLIDFGTTTPIRGLESLKPGDQVPFTCTRHPWMEGTLVVASA